MSDKSQSPSRQKRLNHFDNTIYLIGLIFLSFVVARAIAEKGIDLIIVIALLFLAVGWIVLVLVFLEIRRNKQ